jgi:hypothetical protein
VMTAMWKTVPIIQVHNTVHNTFTFCWWMDSSWMAWGLAAPHMCLIYVNVFQQVELSFISKHHVQDVGDLGNKCLTPLAIFHSFLHIRNPEFLDNSNTEQVNPSFSCCYLSWEKQKIPVSYNSQHKYFACQARNSYYATSTHVTSHRRPTSSMLSLQGSFRFQFLDMLFNNVLWRRWHTEKISESHLALFGKKVGCQTQFHPFLSKTF